MSKTLLSLFDKSGVWSGPFAEAGWRVIQWDIGLADFMDINLIDDAESALELFESVDAILAGVPCTDFASSGAHVWSQKDSDGRTERSKELVRQTLRLVDLFMPTDPDYDGTFFWAIENPVGRIHKLFPELGEPYYFHPYEFAGCVELSARDLARLDQLRDRNGVGITPADVAFIQECGAYTKKTGLWGDFDRRLVKRPVAPVRACAQGSVTQAFGGKSERTKEIRSLTPKGFSQAFFEANMNYTGNFRQIRERECQIQMSLLDAIMPPTPNQ
jgi:hypothetical protein